MRRRIIMGLLALGTVAGFGSGIAHVVHARHHWQQHQYGAPYGGGGEHECGCNGGPGARWGGWHGGPAVPPAAAR